MTLFVNLFAGPGAGKSTTAAAVFAQLKLRDVNAELVTEFAKDKVWADERHALGCSPLVAGEQLWRQHRLEGQVDVAVTDSPLLLACIYQRFGATPSFAEAIREQFALFNNLNIFLRRDPAQHPYNPVGRLQDEVGAIDLDNEIWKLLHLSNFFWEPVSVKRDGSHVPKIVERTLRRLG